MPSAKESGIYPGGPWSKPGISPPSSPLTIDQNRYYCTLARSATPVSDAENTRSKDDAPQGDAQPSESDLSTDITLTALAQLGVLRLRCNRSFVSIIDGDNQHIIAEATGSISLRHKDMHLPDDGIYLGARTLDLVWGVCPHTIKLFTGQDPSYAIETDNVIANRSRYIIRDFTKEDCFKDRPYVREWPHMRFYAEVPLVSPCGFVLGSYCVVDDKPRTEFGDHEVNLLQEIADAIAQHLENVRIAHCHRRSEHLVRGLTNFVKDYAGFDPREVSNDHRLQSTADLAGTTTSNQAKYNGDHSDNGEKSTPDLSLVTSTSTSLTGELSPRFFVGPASGPTEPSSLNSNLSDHRITPGEEKSLEEVLKVDQERPEAFPHNASQVSLEDSVPLADRITAIFSRASVLLRESMDLEGVIFFDAARNNPSFLPTDEHERWEPLPKTAAPEFPMAPCPSPLGLSDRTSMDSENDCDVLSISLKKSQKKNPDPQSDFVMREELLGLLVHHFPQGQIFNLSKSDDSDAYISYDSGSNDPQVQLEILRDISARLRGLIPDAKSIAFFPLWDYHRSRWLAGTLVWSRDSHRALGIEELHYFKIFGDSIVSEVSRAYWTVTEKSKFDFISSVSHELRSPLHGILASAELLQTTSLDSTQKDMVNMIETSGLTLLDTTDYLLEFCKINNFTQVKKSKKRNNAHSDQSSLVSEFDLGKLVEEVSDILYTGHRAPERQPLGQNSSSRLTTGDQLSSNDEQQDEMSLVIRIEQRCSWMIRSLPGAWRRIVMNILGNSIKWTKSGFVEVSLFRARNQPNSERVLVQFSVTDTGSGIAPDFLRHKLFSPFAQEDSLTEGVGLGLSIVRQLVASLEGHINVRSELGIGTQVDVFIPVQCVERPASNIEADAALTRQSEIVTPPLQASLIAFNGYPDLRETPTGTLSLEAKRRLSVQSTLADVFMSQFGWSISMAETLSKARGDVAVIEESMLQSETVNPASLKEYAQKHGLKFFIILGSKNLIFDDSLSTSFVLIPQPFGPQKIRNAVQRILELRATQPEAEVEPSVPTTPSNQEPPVDDGSRPRSSSEEVKLLVETRPEIVPLVTLPHMLPCQQTKAPTTKHVLVVDDNDINLKIMATFMRKIGCSYETASNGLIALEKYKASQRPYDFVLMDISMPIMDGLISTSKIRQYEKENSIQPACIMAVTGVASDSMQQQALAAGINDYLIKPLSLRELKKIMKIA
ncbi:hypothetical protein N7462_004098 [Penicillium macrosclerotiorum]|uniref:uncharacterized protein n=1 Tax=Penicillium macrosclerotiorum TaxID=303699 RepID=UPI002546CBBE|nr:uncharacterized protein N7462_004098 [Penicillium macrosclerotiorum]KAJ5689706.1 hypothetical protein N7462_004098 [Penicillium macrosclerotiorum]